MAARKAVMSVPVLEIWRPYAARLGGPSTLGPFNLAMVGQRSERCKDKGSRWLELRR